MSGLDFSIFGYKFSFSVKREFNSASEKPMAFNPLTKEAGSEKPLVSGNGDQTTTELDSDAQDTNPIPDTPGIIEIRAKAQGLSEYGKMMAKIAIEGLQLNARANRAGEEFLSHRRATPVPNK